MTDTQTAPEGQPQPPVDPAPGPEAGAEASATEQSKAEARARAEAKNLRERLKAAEEKAKRWEEHERSQQSETERWASERTELSTRAATAERRAAQYEAAAAAGLPLDMAGRVQGDTPEAMAADAKELAKVFAGAQQARQRTERSRPDPSQGAGQSATATTGGSEALALNGDPLYQSLRAAVGITNGVG
jgi:hypothetical protein